MIEDKLTHCEETEKFKEAVDIFRKCPPEIDVPLALLLYLGKEKALQVVDKEYLGSSYITTIIENIISHPNFETPSTSHSVVVIDSHKIAHQVVDIINYINDPNLPLYDSYFMGKENPKKWIISQLFKLAEILISFPEEWYKHYTLDAFTYILQQRRHRYFGKECIYILPQEITKLVGEFIDNAYSVIYNPYAGYGDFIDILKNGTIYHAQEHSYTAYLIQLRLLLSKNIVSKCDKEVAHLDWKAKDTCYDYIIASCYNINPTLHGFKGIHNQSLDFLNKSSHDARIKSIGIYPASICHPINTEEKNIIKEILKDDLLDTVITLPSIRFPQRIPYPVIIITNKNKSQHDLVHFIDASKCLKENDQILSLDLQNILEIVNNKKSGTTHRYVSNQEIINNEYSLYPCKYVDETQIKIPKGYSLTLLKDILSPCSTDKTNITKGKIFTRGFYNSKFLTASEIPFRDEIRSSRFLNVITQDSLVVSSQLEVNANYICTEGETILVPPNNLIFHLDTTKVLPSYLLSEITKEYFKEQLKLFSTVSSWIKITSEDFLNLKILVPDKFEDQVALSLEAGNKDLKEHWKQLEEQYQKKFEDFRNGQRQRKHAVAQVLNDLSPAVDLVKTFVDNNDNFGTNSIVSNKSNTTLLAYMQTIQHQLNRVIDMVDKFTNSEKYSEAENIQINEFLEEYCKHQRVNEKYRITLDTSNDIYWTAPSEEYDNNDEEGFTLTVKMGRAELTQILDNLITNANKHGFTDSNRTDYEIRLTTEVVTEATPKLLLKVANNGDPVSRSLQLEKLFTWGGSNGNGTGLGCWQAKDLAEHYNGTLTYQEHPNDENGFVCEFTLSLPLHFD